MCSNKHPYITEEMECFISTKWGTYDYPGGEIISWTSQNNDVYIVCARMDDWEYFFIKDENKTPHNLILECDDVKLEYLEEWK